MSFVIWQTRNMSSLIAGTALLFILLIGNTNAVSPGGQIIERATAYIDENRQKLIVDFTIPVTYQWAFPENPNNQIMLAILPIRTVSPIPTNIREHIRIPKQLSHLLLDAYLDGTEDMRSLLIVLHASQDITVSVTQGTSSRRIEIELIVDQQQKK